MRSRVYVGGKVEACQRVLDAKRVEMPFGRLSTYSWKEPAINPKIFRQDMHLDKFISVW